MKVPYFGSTNKALLYKVHSFLLILGLFSPSSNCLSNSEADQLWSLICESMAMKHNYKKSSTIHRVYETDVDTELGS